MFNSNPLYFIISTPDYSEERKKEENINKYILNLSNII